MKKLLLHTCCAPCASGCIERLVAEEREVTLYFSNSNINAAEEFEKRLETVCKFAKAFQLEVLVDDYDHAAWFRRSRIMRISRNAASAAPHVSDIRSGAPRKRRRSWG